MNTLHFSLLSLEIRPYLENFNKIIKCAKGTQINKEKKNRFEMELKCKGNEAQSCLLGFYSKSTMAMV